MPVSQETDEVLIPTRVSGSMCMHQRGEFEKINVDWMGVLVCCLATRIPPMVRLDLSQSSGWWSSAASLMNLMSFSK